MTTQKVEFEGALGTTLAARMELPEGSVDACAIFAHCFTCSKDVVAATRISRALAGKGIAVLRFDFTGLGSSDGDFANTNFSSNVADLVAAARYLETRWEAPSLLIGHSLGGAATLCAAHELDSVAAVATIGAPFDPAHVEHLFDDELEEIESEGEATVSIAGRSFTVTRQFIDDLRESGATGKISKLGRPLLIMHAPTDNVVSVDNARLIYEAAKHPKSFVSLDGADHLMSNRDDAEYAADVLAAWGARYVAKKREAERESFDAEHDGAHQVVVRETGTGKFTNLVRAGRHTMLADEPSSVGGDDTGPTPYDLFLSAIGACSTMTMRMYAERKGWPVERLEVHLSHAKLHSDDCSDCLETDGGGKLDRVEKHVIIEGDLSDEQRARIFEIASKCPVHKTLQTPTTIASVLEE